MIVILDYRYCCCFHFLSKSIAVIVLAQGVFYLWHCIASYVVATFVDPDKMVVVLVSVVDVVFR